MSGVDVVDRLNRWQAQHQLKELSEGVAGLYRALERAEDGCRNGLTAYGFCHRTVDHEGVHWREDCGAWWWDDKGLQTEREGIFDR